MNDDPDPVVVFEPDVEFEWELGPDIVVVFTPEDGEDG